MHDINFSAKHTRKMLVKSHVQKFLLFPEYWVDPENRLSDELHWKSIQFQEQYTSLVPKTRGVYCFIVEPGCKNMVELRYLLYVGETERTFRDRFKEYLRDQAGKGKYRQKLHWILNLWKDHIIFYYAPISDKAEILPTEQILLSTFVPPANDVIKGKIKDEVLYIYN